MRRELWVFYGNGELLFVNRAIIRFTINNSQLTTHHSQKVTTHHLFKQQLLLL